MKSFSDAAALERACQEFKMATIPSFSETIIHDMESQQAMKNVEKWDS